MKRKRPNQHWLFYRGGRLLVEAIGRQTAGARYYVTYEESGFMRSLESDAAFRILYNRILPSIREDIRAVMGGGVATRFQRPPLGKTIVAGQVVPERRNQALRK